MRAPRRRVGLVAAAALGAIAVGALSSALVFRGNGGHPEASDVVAQLSGRALQQRFAILSRASSNRCGLNADDLDELAHDGRLQGACCRRMNFHRYAEQVIGLRRYAYVPEVPSDPYDVSVSRAKRLLSYRGSIELTRDEQAIYNRAMELSDEGGPCCCHCWRWSAFEGQAKFLIAHRRYEAEQVAAIWTLEDGCGGSGHAHET